MIGYPFLSDIWYRTMNAAFKARRTTAPEPMLLEVASGLDIEAQLGRGWRTDQRTFALNIVLTGPEPHAMSIVFCRGAFSLQEGLVRYCDAVARMPLGVAYESFRQGFNVRLVNAAATGEVAAAGSWPALEFVRTHLVPDWDEELKAVTA